jgi:glycosyltransferase involved in cell wall biosynthesis
VRVAFVVQRYGLEVSGGAELHCRQVVDHLAPDYDIEVLTTCAQDYVTWENVYPEGVDHVNGVPVRRFPTTQKREKAFGDRSAALFGRPHTLRDEWDWLHAQGPVAPDMLCFLAQHHLDYDAFVFFTYIYYPTVLGLRMVADRALLVPTAHDEPPIYLDIYKALFHAPRAYIYNSIEERQLLDELFDVDYIPGDVVGLGIEVPREVDEEVFRSAYHVETAYVAYVGRLSPSKGCEILLDYFLRYKEAHPGPLKLVLVGRAEIPVPNHPDVVATGFVSDDTKFSAIAGADVFLLPSRLESLSMAFLESLALGTPVLCNGESAVLRGHCLRSNAALYYRDYQEFEAYLGLLVRNERLRSLLGGKGKRYVSANYSWDQVVDKYHSLLDAVAGSGWW